ncbi:MAG TPA: hypothetical protein VGC69_02030 [Bordetella sp.]
MDSHVYIDDFFVTGETDYSAALMRAILHLRPFGGGVIEYGSGTFVHAPYASIIAPDEGTAATVSSLDPNISIVGQGSGATIWVPTSNKLEFIAQRGANLRIGGIWVYGDEYGLLQDVPKQPLITPSSGLAGLGNNAFSFIRQYDGNGGLVIDDVTCSQINVGVHYCGDYTDEETLYGDLRTRDYYTDTCCFGLLVEQPERISIIHGGSKNTKISTNADGSTDPGHYLYVTNRIGAAPHTINISHISGYKDHNSTLKVRKGEVVVISNVALNQCGRGIDIVDVQSGSLSNYAAVCLQDALNNPTGVGTNMLEITDTSNFVVDGVEIDIRGQMAYGILMRTDTNAANAKNVTVNNVIVVGDYTDTGKQPLLCVGQSDIKIRDFQFVHTGSTPSPDRWPIAISGCSNVHVINPAHYVDDPSLSDASYLVGFDATCVACKVTYSDGHISVDATTNTVHVSTGGDVTVFNESRAFRLGYDRSTQLDPASTLIAGVQIFSSGQQITSTSGIAHVWQRIGGDGTLLRAFNQNTIVATMATVGSRAQLSLDGSTQCFDTTGAGSPEGVITAGVGSTYRRRDGGAGTSFYVKESGGYSNTGWVAK